jgi:hypothetical protein
VLDIAISSRVFSSGFDIKTPMGLFSAEMVTGEIRVLNAGGDQVARLEMAGLFTNTYNIIITGGGGYQFGRDEGSSRSWTCKGEGKLFRISEQRRRRFLVSDETQEIAEFSKSRFFSDYEVRVFNEADIKVVMCVVIALSRLENQSMYIPA